MSNTYCPACGELLPKSNGRPYTQNAGGWQVCGHHRIALTTAKFDSRCQECLGPIKKGDNVVLVIIGEKENGKAHWAAFHPKSHCKGESSTRVNESAPAGPWAVMYLAPGAPVEVVKAAYKALALKYHPDKPGGSLVKMQEINAAMEKLIR